MPDDVLGEAVKAFVVPRDSAHDALCDRLLAFCKGRMNAQLAPRKIIVLGALPKNANGKVVQQELKKWTTNGDCQPAASFSPPPLRGIARGTSARLTNEFIPVEKREIYQSTLEERIAAIWIEVLGISTVAVDDNFLELGGTSLTAAQVRKELTRQTSFAFSMN